MDKQKKQQIEKSIRTVVDYALKDCKTHEDFVYVGALLQREGFDEDFVVDRILRIKPDRK